MTTEATQADQKKFIFRKLDRVRVKGKKLGVNIYEVVAYNTPAQENLQKEMALSDLALNNYFNQQWDAAEKLFKELHAAHPDTKVYSLYITRIHEFRQNPPPKDWDGVYAHASK